MTIPRLSLVPIQGRDEVIKRILPKVEYQGPGPTVPKAVWTSVRHPATHSLSSHIPGTTLRLRCSGNDLSTLRRQAETQGEGFCEFVAAARVLAGMAEDEEDEEDPSRSKSVHIDAC